MHWVVRLWCWCWLLRPDAVERTGTARQRMGRRAERLAARRLLMKGYDLVARNVRLASGEIDVLMVDAARRRLVVVEVKAGRHEGVYRPEVHVDGRKRRKLATLGREAAAARGVDARRVRVDVVAVEYAVSAGRDGEERWRVRAVRHHAGVRCRPEGRSKEMVTAYT